MNELMLKEKIEPRLTPKRLGHTLGVVEVAKKLAVRYHEPIEQVIEAAFLHDCARNLSNGELLKLAEKSDIKIDRVSKSDPSLLHGPVGAVIAQRDYGVCDESVLNAIRYHTTGRKKMTQLDKIIYLADCIEPGRNYKGVIELRDLAVFDLDMAVLEALTNTLKFLLDKGQLIQKQTVTARNDLILQIKKG
ncbi:bis(5'-nucleosyl)-tetraphosphatase (symmetrical) YqeK [Eubacteriaceae bacterium ES2]|nr:bis(5'-nucleosyl)-tetraphosphatase (symmetrical) YqeK [Eubacteriaceae bacterium ES2]